MIFANIAKRPTDGFFVTTISPYPKQRTANCACTNNDDERYKMRTVSVCTGV